MKEGKRPFNRGVEGVLTPSISAEAEIHERTSSPQLQRPVPLAYQGSPTIENSSLVLSNSSKPLFVAEKGVEGVLTPSISAEAEIHERTDSPQLQRPVPLAYQGNPRIEIPPLYYDPTEQTGWIYMVANRPNGTIYIGQTTNLPQRIWQHKEGKVEGFTKKYGCKTLVYFEGYHRITESIERETVIKEWPRKWKIRRILETNPGWRDLYADICAAGA